MLSGSASTRYRIRFQDRASIAHAQNARTAGAGELAVAASRMRGNLHGQTRKSGTATCRFRAWSTSTKRQHPHPRHPSSRRPPPPGPARRWSPRSRRRACSSLQRTIGNRATSAILARAPAAGAGDFGVTGGVPVSSGSVIASKEGADKVNVKAPLVTLDGAAWLKKDRELGTSAYIGVVQNLVSSVRGAVYRHGGDPTGEIVAEHVAGQANKRDAVSDPQQQHAAADVRALLLAAGQHRRLQRRGHAREVEPARDAERPARVRHAGHLRPGPDHVLQGPRHLQDGPRDQEGSGGLDAHRARRGRWTGTSRSTRTSAAPARRSRPRRSRTCSRTARTSASRPGRWTRTR